MDGFEKRLFSSKSTAGPRSTGFSENNENDSSQNTVMSPTISAASKAAASPRKKILGERKQNLGVCDAHGHKKLNLNWNNSPQSNVSSHDLGSESEDDNLYDPLKNNYLSPRPKYLRFNPNGRREIVERLGREVRDEFISSSKMGDSCFSPRKISVESADEDEEEEDEEEEDKGWCLRGVFTLIACLLSALYICSMNPSTTQQAVWKLRDGYLMMHRQALEFVNGGVLQVEVRDVYSEVDEYHGGIDTVEVLERPGNDDHDHDKDAEIEFTQAAKTNETVCADGLEQEDNETHNFVGLMDAKTDESVSELVMDVEGPNQLQEIELSMASIMEGEVVTGFYDEMESKSVVEEKPKHEELVPSHETFIGYGSDVVEEGEEVVIGFHDEMESKSVVEETPKHEELVPSHGTFIGHGSEVVVEEGEVVIGFHDEMESKSVVEETPKLEELVPSHEGYGSEVVEMEKKEGWNTSIAAIGTIVAFLFSTLLAFVYRSKKAKETKSILKPHKLAVEDHKVFDRKVEFLARRPSSPPPPPHSKEEFSHHIYAPSVELIGEIVIGSHGSCRKYKTTEFEESNATPIKQQSFTTSSSTSYGGGSFTNEGRGHVGEPITPVRRSSRLRNRAATIASPY